jgi:two-component system response regulator FixJ
MTTSWVIHVIDDDEAVRSAFVFALTACGFQTVPYVDADDFLTRGWTARGVLISDVRMPGMNGIELTRRLRQDGSTMPIILVTGHADAELTTEAMSAGADLMMRKPADLAALVVELARMTGDWD